jgi:hypothetical protein
MTGWKTWVAAISSILWGVAGLLAGIHGPDVAVGFVTGGFALIGIGHKVEKIGATIAEKVAG